MLPSAPLSALGLVYLTSIFKVSVLRYGLDGRASGSIVHLNNPNYTGSSVSRPSDDSYCQASRLKPESYIPLKESTLLSIHLITRHGDRVPSRFLPLGLKKDSWYCNPETTQIVDQDISKQFIERTTVYNQDLCTPEGYCSINPLSKSFFPGNCSRGQLTPKGSKQHYDLGDSLSKIYIDRLKFLDREWNNSESEIYVRSTDYMRTQQSATSLISGMFRNSISSVSKLLIYTLPGEIENLVTNTKLCPKSYKLKMRSKNLQLIQAF